MYSTRRNKAFHEGPEYLHREKRPILRVPVFLYVKEADPITQGKGLFL